MVTRRKPKIDPALKKALAWVAQAKDGDLPAIVTKQRVDENGAPVFINGEPDRTVGVIDGGKWRPLNTLEAAILKRCDELRNGPITQGGGGGGPIEPL